MTSATTVSTAETAVLGEWASSLRWSDLPEPVKSAAALHFLDALGVGVAVAATPFGSRLLSRVATEDTGPAPLIGSDHRVDELRAALVNGTLIHGLEYDDTHIPSVIHGSAVALPAVLSQAHRDGVTVDDLMAGFVVGWEALIRLGLLAPGAYQARGFQTAAACGPPAAALAAGRLRAKDPSILGAAFAVATSFSSGLMAYAQDGATVKRAHLGWAAHGGVAAVDLAEGGLTGPGRPLRAENGFLAVLAGVTEHAHVDGVLNDVGQRWYLPDVSFKLYPVCHYIHSYLDAVLELRARRDPATVGAIECEVHPAVVPVIADNPEQRRRPRTLEEAQYSLFYCAAQMFVHGHCDLEDLSGAQDGEVLAFAERVRAVVNPDMEYPGLFPAVVRVLDDNGTVLEELSIKGPHGATMAQQDLANVVRQKFVQNTAPTWGEERARSMFDRLREVDAHVGEPAAQWWR